MEESWIDYEQKSDHIIAQADKQPFSCHEESVEPYLIFFLLELIRLYEIVTSGSYWEKLFKMRFHKASLLTWLIIFGFCNIYWRVILGSDVLEILINGAEGL